MATVYYIVRSASGKGYVGWTSLSPEKRFERHCQLAVKGSKTHFHAAIRKYGAGAWEIRTLALTESVEEAKLLERKFIEQLDSVECGYNLTNGGDGLSDPTGEISRKISRTLKGRGLGIPKSELTKQKMRGPKSAEHRLHISQVRIGKKFSLRHRRSLSLAKIGKKTGPASIERRERIRASITSWWERRRNARGNGNC